MKLGEAGRKSCDKLLSEDCEINGKFQRRQRCLEATESHVCEEEVRPVREIKKEGKIKSRKNLQPVPEVEKERGEIRVFPRLQSTPLMKGCTPAPLRKTHKP